MSITPTFDRPPIVELVLGEFVETSVPQGTRTGKFDERWKTVIDELLAARNLADDWDGQGAKAPAGDVVDTAIQLTIDFQKQGYLPPEDYGPSVNGTIVLGWRTDEWSVELEIFSPDRVEGFRWKKGAERAEEFVLSPCM